MLDENFTPKVRKYFPLSHYNVSYLIDHFQMQIKKKSNLEYYQMRFQSVFTLLQLSDFGLTGGSSSPYSQGHFSL